MSWVVGVIGAFNQSLQQLSRATQDECGAEKYAVSITDRAGSLIYTDQEWRWCQRQHLEYSR